MKEPGPIAITMGEPAGIGGEIVLKAWAKRERSALPPFFVIDDRSRLADLSTRLGLQIPLSEIDAPAEAEKVFTDALPVIHRALEQPVALGNPDSRTAKQVIASIEDAVRFCATGQCKAVVTNPIQKSVLYESGFDFPGHTEFLAHLCVENGLTGERPIPVMMLTVPTLRVVPVTVHLPLRDVPSTLSRSLIVDTASVVHQALVRDFGFKNPRIAVAGLNPHAGEDGRMGDEEETIIAPAIDELRKKGWAVDGPRAPDTLFHQNARHEYDAVLCMYHDQALIPLKTIDFDHGVNATLGLPIVRTSPDHGTALNIAGTGRASPESLIEAIHLANFMAERRRSSQSDG